jgi:iron(III) transport system permease protein
VIGRMGRRGRPPHAEGIVLHAAGAVLALVMMTPVVWLLVRASGQSEGAARAVLLSPALRESVGHSLLLAGIVSTLCIAVSLPLAWLTHATDLPLRATMRRLAILPLAVPSFVSGFVVVATLGHGGPLAEWGLRPPEVYGLFGATVALLFTYPYVLIPLQAALARVDPRTWEAARSLGASPWGAFRTVVLPALRPAIGSGGLLVALYVLGDFGAVSLLRYPTLSYRIYVRYGSPFLRHEAVWYALVLGALALVVVALARWVGRAAVSGPVTSRPWPILPLGRWRWPAFVYVAGVVSFGALLPVAVVSWWLVRGLRAGNTLASLAPETWNTLWLGVSAAALITVAGLVPALLRRYGNARFARWVDRACHVGYALPGLVVALALVYLGARALPSLYQTVWMLQLAYLVRFLPQAIGSLDHGLAAQSPRLYDAALVLGRRPVGAWFQVVLPVAAPAIAASLLAVFLSVVKELPATLLLRPPGFPTLAQRIWSLTEDAFFTAAAPTVLLLLVLAIGALWLRPDSALRTKGRSR